MSDHTEGFYYVCHFCGDENLEPSITFHTFDKALAHLERMRGRDKLDHLNCQWEIHFELREYHNNRLAETRTMKVLDTP